MSEPSLTDAVIQAVVFAHHLVLTRDWYGNWPGDPQAIESLLRSELEALDRSIRAGNALVERAAEFRNLYPRIPRRIGGESAPSFHELGRKLAMRIFNGIVSTAWEVDTSCRPKELDCGYGPEHFDAIMRQWQVVQTYLRDEAPRFDPNRLVANIQDEAAKAAQRLRLPADPGGQSEGGNGNGKTPPRATIAARMIDLIKDPTTHLWTCHQFAEKLGCQPSTVVATAAWKQLAVARESARLQQAEQAYKKGLDVKADKRRRPKRKQRPDSLGD